MDRAGKVLAFAAATTVIWRNAKIEGNLFLKAAQVTLFFIQHAEAIWGNENLEAIGPVLTLKIIFLPSRHWV